MRIIASSLLLSALAATACIPGRGISPYGRPATVHLHGAGSASGELLAVSPDSVWLWRDSSLQGFTTKSVRIVTVERHRYGSTRTMALMAITGTVSGLMLQGACARIESDCGYIFSGVLGFSLASGALLSIINHYSSLYRFPPGDVDRMRPLARFPQGLPDSIRTAGRPQ